MKNNKITNLLNSSAKKLLTTTAITAVGFLSVAGEAKANNWNNTTTTHGATTTDTSQANTTSITLGTQRARIEGDLDIDAGHKVLVGKGDLVAVDTEGDAVGIFGTLDCAGSCHVFGSNGIIVGDTGTVNAHSVTLSTGELTNVDKFIETGDVDIANFKSGSEVDIRGTVNADDFAGFFAPTVKNSGIINAKMGTVAMGAGEQVTLDLYGDGLVEVAVDGELAEGLIENTGAIKANGGNVIISAKVAKEAVENVINLDGVIDASSATMKGGKIVISGGKSGTVAVKGKVDASGKGGKNAGSIKVTGKNIKVAKTAKIAANSQKVAGDIVVVADKDLQVDGSIEALSDELRTGFIETSGATVNFGEGASILANREWLIDPTDLLVDAANEAAIEAGLTAGDVTLTTASAGTDAGNIDVNTVIDWTTGNTFTLNADNNVNFNAGGGVNATGAGNFVANAANSVRLNPGASGIVTNAGNIALNAGNEFTLAGGQVATFNGNILIDNAGAFEALASSIRNFGTGTVELNQNKPSGAGTIANPTIQNAVNSVFTQNGAATTINVGAGTWVESVNLDYNNLTLNGNNAGIHGTGVRNAETIIASVSGAGFTSTNTDMITIDGFTIDGGNLAGSVAVQADNADNLFVDNNIIQNNEVGVDVINSHCPHIRNNLIDNNGTGVSYTNNTHAFISVNTITNTTGNAVQTNGVVENDIFQNIIDHTGGNAIDVVGGDDVLIVANLIGQNGGKDSIGGVGIQASNDVDRLIIDSNNIMNTANDGIDLINIGIADPDNQTFVRNNTISMAATIGIDAENSDNVFIDGNNISNTPTAIEVTDSHCPFVINNTITDVETGVNYENTTHSFVAQNTITNVTNNAVQTTGVVELDIFQNIIDEVGGNAIDVDGGDDAFIFANLIGQNGGKDSIGGVGIQASNDVDRLIIDSNNIMNTADDGIDLINIGIADPDNQTFVRNNTISMAATIGIDAENSDNVFIDGNNISNTPTAIEVTDSHCPFVINNTITDVETGVNYENTTHSFVAQNTITNVTNNAVQTTGVVELDIFQNIIDEVGGNAIDVEGGDDAFLFANLIGQNGGKDSIGENGIHADNVDNLIVDGNQIMNTTEDGIDLLNMGLNSPDNQTFVRNNTISMAGVIGIDAENSDNVFIDFNNISSTPTAIEVTDSHCPHVRNNTIDDVDVGVNYDNNTHAFIAQNTITNTTSNAIQTNGVVENDIFQNIVDNVGGDGIEVMGGGDALIFGNNIGLNGTIGEHGIEISGTDLVDLRANTIQNAAIDGVNATDLTNAAITGNNISRVGDDGIDLTGGSNITINDNTIDLGDKTAAPFDRDGITVSSVADLTVDGNTISNVSGYGVHTNLITGSTHGILENIITNTGNDGIFVENSVPAIIAQNQVTNSWENAIHVDNTDGSFIAFNTLEGPAQNGVLATNSDGLQVAANTIQNTGADGVKVLNADNLNIANNTITDTTDHAIHVEDVDNTQVSGNTVLNSSIGLDVVGPNNGVVSVFGNSFTNSDIGAQFESGQIDLTGAGNTFTGGNTALRFDPGSLPGGLTLVGDTVGAQTFDSQTDAYIEFVNGAFFNPGTPTDINANDAVYLNTPFGDFTPSIDFPDGLPATHIDYLESQFVHFNDDNTLGRLLLAEEVIAITPPALPTPPLPPTQPQPLEPVAEPAPVTTGILQEDIFNTINGVDDSLGGLNVTIAPLSSITGFGPSVSAVPAANTTPTALNNLAPNAGGEDLSPEALNNLETAAGGNDDANTSSSNPASTSGSGDTTCWNDALGVSEAGETTVLNYGGSIQELLDSESSCQASVGTLANNS